MSRSSSLVQPAALVSRLNLAESFGVPRVAYRHLAVVALILACLVSAIAPSRVQAQNITVAPMINTVPSTFNSLFGTGVLHQPSGVVLDSQGNLYIAEAGIQDILKVDARTGKSSAVVGGYRTGCPGETDKLGDGCPANNALLWTPEGLALDKAGNLYIADSQNNLVRKVDAVTGKISALAGGGTGCTGQTDSYGDGCSATNAQLGEPNDVAVDGAGNVFIADTGFWMIRRVDGQTGIITAAAGTGSDYASTSSLWSGCATDPLGDGCPATQAWLHYPYGVAVDIQGNLYIADSYNLAVRKVDAKTGIITYVAGGGSCAQQQSGAIYWGGCLATSFGFSTNNPQAVAVDSAGNLYFMDNGVNSITRVDAASGIITPFVNVIGSPGYTGDEGVALFAELNGPSAIALDGSGNLYIADTGNNVIREVSTAPPKLGQVPVNTFTNIFPVLLSINTALTLSSVQATGDYSLRGLGGIDLRNPYPSSEPNPCVLNTPLSANTGCFQSVQFVPTKPGPRWFPLVLTDSNSNKYSFGLEGTGVGSELAFTPGIISTIAGTYSCCGTNGYPTGGFSGDGYPAIQALLSGPGGEKMDSAGNLYFVDSGNYRVRKIDTSGNISTVAGSGSSSYSGDGGPAIQAGLNPSGLALDSAGNLYIADYENNRVRKVDVNGNITTVAGPGSYPYTCNGYTDSYGDGCVATSAELTGPSGVAVDAFGNLYIAEQANALIRKVDLNGIISTVAGNGSVGFSGDGGLATGAQLNNPTDVAVDAAGNLYIADYANFRVRKVDATTGNISTFAGNGTSGNSSSYNGGPAINAELWNPGGLALDSAGDIYIATPGRIWKVDPSGIINTVAGADNNSFKYSGDGGPATSAGFGLISGVAVDGAGILYVADGNDNVIRKVDVTTSILSFSSINALETSPAQSMLVSNIGNAPLNFISLTDTSVPTNFVTETVGNDCAVGTPLAVGATCSLGMSFRPTAAGILNDTLAIADDTFNSPQSVQLSGIATAPIASLYVQAGTATATGQAFYFDVTAKDSSNNTVTGYSGTVHFSSSDPAATLPADYTFTAADKGLHAFFLAFNTPGSQTVTVTDTSNTSLSATVARTLKGPIFGFFQQSNAKAGLPVLIEVFAEDGNGNSLPTYTGTVHFTSSDPQAILPADYTFTAADAGTHANFNLTLNTQGNQTVTVTDTVNPLMTGSVIIPVAQGQAATTTTVTTNPSSIIFGRPLTLTATVTAAFFDNAALGGSVSFYAGAPAQQSQTLGTVPFPGFTKINDTTYQASITVSGGQFTASTYNFNVVYSGDYNYVSSSSNFTLSAATYGNAAILYANSGYLQATPMQTAFANPLTVLVTDSYNDPVPGVTVTFSAPTSGPSATLSGTTVTTDSTGQGSVTAIANALPGMYTVTANMSGSNVNFTLMNVSGTPQSFGSVAVGSSTTETLWYPSYMGTTSVVFEYGIEFSAGTPSCTNSNPTFTNPALCNVNVIFQPKYPGLRTDALILTDQSGNDPRRIALFGAGTGSIAAFTPGVIKTMAGNGTAGYRSSDDGGLATSAELNYPAYVAFDIAGNFYIADYNNALVRKVDTSGNITTVAGNGTYCPDSTTPCGDGYAASSANLRYPSGLAVDSMGNIYIADSADHRIRVMSTQTTEINVLGTVIQPGTIKTVAGNGTACTVSPCGDGNYAVWGQLNWPTSVALDGAGNLYIADFHDARVRKVNVSNSYQNYITTVAGNGTTCPTNTDLCGDGGPATQAQLNGPDFVLVDNAGNLYITDTWDNRIRVVNTQSTTITVFGVTIQPGNIDTVAGTGNWGYRSTDEGVSATTAELNAPTGLAMDAAGNLYIADANNQLIRRVSPNGIITSVAGNGTLCNYSTSSCGDNGPATSAGLNGPNGVTVDSTGSLYIADRQNNRVRKVDVTTSALSFGTLNVGQTSGAQSIAVSDVGNAALDFTSLAVSPSSPFQIVGSGCAAGTTLAVGGTCTVSVAFAPTTPGNLTDSLTVNDDAFNNPQTVSLSGTAIQVAVAQTITFTLSPTTLTYGISPFALVASASSGLPVTFTVVSGPGSVNGSTLTITGAGSIVIEADQAGNSSYTAAPPVQQTLIVNQAAPVITWSAPAAITYGTPLGSSQLNAAANVSGSFSYTPAAGTVLTAGPQTLSVAFTPTDTTDYSTATSSVTLTVNKATPAITWPTPAAITYGTALSGTQLDATASVPGTIAYNPIAGTVLGAGPQTLTVNFTPTDTTDYSIATATVALTVNKATPAITWPTPVAITYGTALSGTQLDATASVPGAFTYTPASGTVLGTGSQTLSVAFTPMDTIDYTTATATVALTVNKATPVITWAAPAAITYGTALGGLQLNATASVAGTFTYNPPAGTVLGAGMNTLSATFTPSDMTDYSVVPVQVTLQVKQATPMLAWTPASIQLGYALGAAQLDATANVLGTFTYTPPAGTAIMSTSQTLSVLFTPTDTTDYTTASMSVPLTVTPGPLANVSPSSINFGTVYLGTITIKNVTVTNHGNAPMTITDPFLSIVSGGDSEEFVMANLCPKPLAAGKSCTIAVSFIAGPFYNPQTATIQVIDNAPGSPQTVNLTATVINPQANFQPASLNFGTEPMNSSTTKTVTLTNTGATKLNISNIAITGTNAADFTQASACPSSLAAGTSCTISVTFTPGSRNTFVAGLTVTDNTFLGKQTILLTAAGH
jgi:sugar lactone lactonase YvrE